MSEPFETSKDVERLKEKYFSDPSRRVQLRKGDVLLREGHFNDKLFLILEGTLTGSLIDDNNEQWDIFRSTRNMFVGVYSFFSPEHTTYLTLVAEESTTVAFIEQSCKEKNKDEFATDFLPVIVHELYLRQLLAQRLTRQRRAAIKMLYEKEKMATLGQLAAGLAHELNNAVAVLGKNTDWLSGTLGDYLRNRKLQHLFLTTFEQGQPLNTITLREKRKQLEKRFDIPPAVAKHLAKTSLTPDEINALLKENKRELESISLVTEAAIVLHDMQIAAKHAAHVVQSVRVLGLSNTEQITDTSLFETVNKALALTKTMLHNITISIQRETNGDIRANPGDLVQVWVNLIKNAAESMNSSATENPVLTVTIREVSTHYEVIVSDNGPGIRSDVISKIFQPNFTTKVDGLSFGLGLGLSIVKKVVNHYKGAVRVESQPGETSFIVELPKP